MAQQNYIGGEWRDAIAGGVDYVINPATGEVMAEVASSDTRRCRRGCLRRHRGVSHLGSHHPPRAIRRSCSHSRTRSRRTWTSSSHLEMDNVGKPVSIIEFEFDLTVDNLRFFAGAARTMQTQAAGEYIEDHTSMLRRDPLGVCAGHRPVELSAQHGDLEAGAGVGGRQHVHPQAERAHTAERSEAGGAVGRHLRTRRVQRGHRARARPPVTRW